MWLLHPALGPIETMQPLRKHYATLWRHNATLWGHNVSFGAHDFHCPSGRGAVISHYNRFGTISDCTITGMYCVLRFLVFLLVPAAISAYHKKCSVSERVTRLKLLSLPQTHSLCRSEPKSSHLNQPNHIFSKEYTLNRCPYSQGVRTISILLPL